MTANQANKLYGRLTAAERFRAMLSAAARGDKVEQRRLVRSAPEVIYTVPDSFGRAMAFCAVHDANRTQQLESATYYFRALATAEAADGKDRRARLFAAAKVFAYTFGILRRGWEAFALEHGFHPGAILPDQDDALTSAAEAIEEPPAAEEVLATLRLAEPGAEQVRTSESVASELAAEFVEILRVWGCE